MTFVPIGWKAHHLDELGFVGRGRSRHRPRNHPSLYGGSYPFVQTADIKAAHLRLHEFTQTYNEIGLAQSKKWEPGTLCITIAANIAETAILAIPACFPDSVIGFLADPKKADAVFIKYCIDFMKLRMQQVSHGTTQDNLSLDKLLHFDFIVPEAPVQRKISAILSAYDDLIENNLRRIKILEEMAQSLYREWFVKFHFPGHQKVKMVDLALGKIPEGWEIKNLFELADVTYGFPFKSSLFNVNRDGIPVVRIRDVLDGQSATFTTEDAPDKYIVHDGDFLVGMDGDFHMGFWAGGTAFLVQRVARFRPRGDVGRYGLALALKEPIEHFNKTITGTTVAHLGDNHLRTINTMMPDKKLLKVINDIIEPLLDLQLNIRAKNKNLRQTRDLLLPKLVSGELDVSELDITVPEANA